VRTTKRTKINLFIVIYQLSRFKKSSYKFNFTKTDKVTAKIEVIANLIKIIKPEFQKELIFE